MDPQPQADITPCETKTSCTEMSQLGSARNSFNAALNRNDSQKSAGLSELTTLKSASETPPEDFKPGWRFLFAFICLCIVNLVCALDATSISVALPVSLLLVLVDHD